MMAVTLSLPPPLYTGINLTLTCTGIVIGRILTEATASDNISINVNSESSLVLHTYNTVTLPLKFNLLI